MTGLSDVDISNLGYNPSEDVVIINYSNGNIDLIQENRINNFTDLLNSNITSSKKVNHVFSQGSLSYLSADFGMMILDLDRNEVKDTYFELGAGGSVLRINPIPPS